MSIRTFPLHTNESTTEGYEQKNARKIPFLAFFLAEFWFFLRFSLLLLLTSYHFDIHTFICRAYTITEYSVLILLIREKKST
jgi:hypothetical protein